MRIVELAIRFSAMLLTTERLLDHEGFCQLSYLRRRTRTVIGLHSTWLVNSATHMWGTQRFSTGDTSRNSFWVALLTFGEGWHNNHHAHPQAARHGLAWYELDLNWYGISALRTLGLAWDVKVQRLNPDLDRTGQSPSVHNRQVA